jgi:hypothetical protein
MAKRRSGQSHLYLQALYFALGGFALSFGMTLSFEDLSQRIPLEYSLPLFMSVVLFGIVSDAVGIAATRAKEDALLSMGSRRVRGAREALWFVRNAPWVSSVFSDLMGDVSATLSGALAVAMAFRLRARFPGAGWAYFSSGAVGAASFLAVGGKALFKPFALKYAESIILLLGKMRRLYLGAFGGNTTRK